MNKAGADSNQKGKMISEDNTTSSTDGVSDMAQTESRPQCKQHELLAAQCGHREDEKEGMLSKFIKTTFILLYYSSIGMRCKFYCY